MKLLLLSNSTNYKEPYLGWCMPLISDFLRNEKKRILFFPYAGVKVAGKNYPESYDAYSERVATIFVQHGFQVDSIHNAIDPIEAVNQADVIMVGGGNTFHLVHEIHANGLIEPVRRKVLEGTPFIGWSAGSNVACPTLRTTNDMPIIMPKSFQCFDFVPFQINPHYIDPHPEEINDAIRHGGETRQDRINEFLAVNPHITVAGLREGTALWVENDKITLRGERPLRIMRHEQEAFEIEPGSGFDFGFNA
ncbi:MAG: dipeptidase PepE [Bacteroidales bacterium]|nr:dipeptidase PepE [Bacteroidales bacterium]